MSEDRPEYKTGKFEGFETPKQNYSKLPHSLIDALHIIKTVSELKVILYVLRHTWGFSEFGVSKKITLDEMCEGRKKRGGTRIDRGTGLSKNSVRSGVSDAIEHGFLLVEKDESDKARIETYYCLNILGVQSLNPGAQSLSPEVQSLNLDQRKKLKKETEEKDKESYDRRKGIEEAKERKAQAEAKKAGRDPVDWLLGNASKIQAIESMRRRVEKALNKNLVRQWDLTGSDWNGYEQELIAREKETGETIEMFMEWFNEDEFRRNNQRIWLKPAKIEELWPEAFTPQSNSTPEPSDRLETL